MEALTSANTTPLRILENCSREFGCKIYGKLETHNLTGSHKDRESEAIVRFATRKRVLGLAIASTGNAAISLSAYSYIHKIKCHVFVPKGIAPERLGQIKVYDPEITYSKSYREAILECQEFAKQKRYLNCNPGARKEKVTGDSGIGMEIAGQSWTYVVCPTNNGTLLAGVWIGLRKSHRKPVMIAAVAKQTMLAEGIAGFHRIEEPLLSEALAESRGRVVELTDDDISHAARLLVKDGLLVEGAAAGAVGALKYIGLTPQAKVCCVITGSGLRFPNSLKELLVGEPN